MQLTPRQQRALEAICDTFAPGGDGWPSAAQLGVPAAILASLDSNPREAERDQIRKLIENGSARGVLARTRSGHLVNVKARAVIAACGGIHTPALLLRSGLRNPHVGAHLHLHPVTVVWGILDEKIRPWEGTLQAIYSDQHRTLYSFHIMGSARLGASPKTSACNPESETWEARNLYVMDACAFPSASGVNPMISIEAIAHRCASALAARL